ncbi:uncharacterized protein LOC144470587 [Augochlora pura]
MSTKKSELSMSVRNEIISLQKSGKSYRKIDNSLNLSLSTVKNVVKKFKETGSVENKSRSGRSKVVTIRKRRGIIKEAIKNLFESAKSLAVGIATYSGKEVNAQRVRNVLHSAEVYDESKFNLFGSDEKRFVWSKPNTELNQKNVIPRVKYGDGQVMVWGCMSYHGVGNLAFIDDTMNASIYINVLRNNLLTSTTKMGIKVLF